jgi:hypothetical protein
MTRKINYSALHNSLLSLDVLFSNVMELQRAAETIWWLILEVFFFKWNTRFNVVGPDHVPEACLICKIIQVILVDSSEEKWSKMILFTASSCLKPNPREATKFVGLWSRIIFIRDVPFPSTEKASQSPTNLIVPIRDGGMEVGEVECFFFFLMASTHPRKTPRFLM